MNVYINHKLFFQNYSIDVVERTIYQKYTHILTFICEEKFNTLGRRNIYIYIFKMLF